ncbi:bifunctional adenosylcobinamide kinase/adenosylcobinamide-phosphate guanylyltransferase [Shewanella youngdeokensis]|uniref:Bifunctional adenosylcobalamin biosynthesis protein n=1 Tax=Shewanella youngdeokensis TaxID=2999068 RepID=A0ABZ0K230_9GAMM|nr:bifunctional adenosylcobinamide kinase/adenosylcobinamide-phosphate guanylyltransferase [Shewanella sp. DAU334]
MIQFILGGARSGKSRFAEAQVKQYWLNSLQTSLSRNCIYIATAEGLDQEMAARIAQHQSQRKQGELVWRTVESPLALTAAIKTNSSASNIILVDCLTLWLSNHLLQSPDDWQATKADFLEAISASSATIVLVSNEVGNGIVPMGEINRRFVDEAGWLHQDVAALADNVTLVTAGLPMSLKGRHV